MVEGSPISCKGRMEETSACLTFGAYLCRCFTFFSEWSFSKSLEVLISKFQKQGLSFKTKTEPAKTLADIRSRQQDKDVLQTVSWPRARLSQAKLEWSRGTRSFWPRDLKTGLFIESKRNCRIHYSCWWHLGMFVRPVGRLYTFHRRSVAFDEERLSNRVLRANEHDVRQGAHHCNEQHPHRGSARRGQRHNICIGQVIGHSTPCLKGN